MDHKNFGVHSLLYHHLESAILYKYCVFGHYLSSYLYLNTILFIFQNTFQGLDSVCLDGKVYSFGPNQYLDNICTNVPLSQTLELFCYLVTDRLLIGKKLLILRRNIKIMWHVDWVLGNDSDHSHISIVRQWMCLPGL